MSISKDIVDQIREIVTDAGCEFDGIQESLLKPPRSPEIIFQTTEDNTIFSIPFNPERINPGQIVDFIQDEIDTFRKSKKKEKKMTLKEKLHKIYETVNHIEKNGFNKQQNYHFIRSADVSHAIRKKLTELKIYAEINFEFVGQTYTIARTKDPNAPFSAVNVRCFVVFHDLESNETYASSGLGTGCDTSDKAAYKAQTGALKYALKNAFLVPDEADPEADESVDEGSNYRSVREEHNPDLRETRSTAPAPVERRAESPVSYVDDPGYLGLSILIPDPAESVDAPETISDANECLSVDIMPTEKEMDIYRKKFNELDITLAEKGKFKNSRGLPTTRKLLNFMLNITKAEDAKNMTKGQWDDFFTRANAATSLESGFVDLVKLINKTNGVEEKK